MEPLLDAYGSLPYTWSLYWTLTGAFSTHGAFIGRLRELPLRMGAFIGRLRELPLRMGAFIWRLRELLPLHKGAFYLVLAGTP